ncbi:tetratricopeptide repeat protein [Microcystis sp. Msp_OC_L_20101000_S702]|uniref:tetratricopeptide repeat protein n=1 Tax=Microcystis sp. Msp_OC_L_20101000_S702 TaxID=2486218 RepID=UPI00257EB62B|nr:tetratricopeptide repeat protein [Microcystis sp. Msp_OC_L_20101000_S702]
MWNSIIQFYQTNKDWIDNLLSGALVTVVLAIIGFIWWYREQKRKVRIIEPSLPFTKIAPNSNVIPIIYKRDEKDKSPLADHNIIYQHRMADRNFTNELLQNLEENRWLIILGPTGIGKTREAAEVAQRLNHEGWTVLVLKLGEWLERPENKQLEAIGTDRKLLFFLDDLNSYMRRSLKIDQNPQAKDSPLAAINIPLQERLLKTLEAYENHCTRPEEVRVIATARDEKEPELPGQPSEWDKLQWDKYPKLWNRFHLVELPSPEDGAIVELLQDTIPQTNIKAETDYSSIAAYNDSTFRNVVENLVRLDNRQLPLNPANYQATLRGNWKKRYQDAIKRDTLAKYIYAAVDLLRQCNISLEPFIVEPTARFIAKGNMWQQLWYRWKIKQSLADLIARENILEPRDGQIEAKGKQVELNDYLRPLKQLIWQLFEEKPLEMLPSLAGFTLKLYELNRYRDALKGFNRLVSLLPQWEDGWFYRGNTFVYLEQYQEAIASWDRALEIKPDKHEAWNNRGVALGNLGRLEEAIASWDRALEIKPDDPDAWNNRGNALYNLGRLEEAIASWDRALEIKPDDPDAWYNRGVALGNLGRFEQAIASWDRALEIKPDDPDAWNNRGVALGNLGRFEQAIASWDRALEIKPDDPDAWYNRGVALGNLGRFEQAIASYDRALEFKPDKHEAWNNRGNALDDLGRFEEAIASYDRALEFKPDDPDAWNNRGNALYNLGRLEEAIASFDRALEIKPDLHEAWDSRGAALTFMGRYKDALESCDRAIKINPNYANAYYNKACCYGLQNNVELAIENLQRAINLDVEYQDMAKTDKDFEQIRGDERFQSFLNRV